MNLTLIFSRLNAQDILANRKDGESIMQHLSSDFNVLKQCLKSKELWQKLSDEEKAYCYKAKAKMKASKKLQEEVSGPVKRLIISLETS